MTRKHYVVTGSYNKSIALEYIKGCIEQCSNIADFNKTVGIIDFITYCNMISYEENSDLRNKLFESYKKNCK